MWNIPYYKSTLNTILLWLPIIYRYRRYIIYKARSLSAIKCLLIGKVLHAQTIPNWYACSVVNGLIWEHVPDWNISINPRMKCIPDGSPIFSLYLSLTRCLYLSTKHDSSSYTVSIYMATKMKLNFYNLRSIYFYLLCVCR